MLALELGMTVQQLGQSMTAYEETLWMGLYKSDPWGYMRTDAGLGQISQLLFNTQAKKQDRRPLTDFMLYFRKPIKAQPDVDQNIRGFFSKFKKDK